MDRRTVKLPFVTSRLPDWECPTCGKGHLKFKKDSFTFEECADSRDHSHEAWDPDWIRYVYSGFLVCTNDKCKEVVATGGTGGVEETYGGEDEDGYPDIIYADSFRPKYFVPHLRLFKIPPGCAEEVKVHIERSFSLFFSEPPAAENSMRRAVEALLTDLGVRRFAKINGKRKAIALHSRILMLPKKFDALKDLLLAIKWLGNAGSHDGKAQITADDVLDSYEFMDHVLQEIYVKKLGALKKLAKKVNMKKGPAK